MDLKKKYRNPEKFRFPLILMDFQYASPVFEKNTVFHTYLIRKTEKIFNSVIRGRGPPPTRNR